MLGLSRSNFRDCRYRFDVSRSKIFSAGAVLDTPVSIFQVQRDAIELCTYMKKDRAHNYVYCSPS